MLVEVLLKFLIGKVDVELLEAIDVKVLKAKDVEYPDKDKRLSSLDAGIDLLQDPTEEVGIQPHGH